MRKNISFMSKGLRCIGWLYVPDSLKKGEKAPAIVMAHGFTAVKEQALPDFAEKFSAAGFVTLVFDYRFFGESEGEPRSQVFPLEMVEDYRNAMTWFSDQPEVDPERMGIWGTSFSGGLVLYTGTHDRRVKAVVAQVPAAVHPETFREMNPQAAEMAGKFLIQDRIARYKTGVVNYAKVVSPGGEICILQGKEAYEGYRALKDKAPNWKNQVTFESLEKMREFDPVSLVHMMAPTPLLMIAAEKDSLIPFDAVKATYERAREPQALTVFPIGHFEVYAEPWLSKAAAAAIDWFKKYL